MVLVACGAHLHFFHPPAKVLQLFFHRLGIPQEGAFPFLPFLTKAALGVDMKGMPLALPAMVVTDKSHQSGVWLVVNLKTQNG